MIIDNGLFRKRNVVHGLLLGPLLCLVLIRRIKSFDITCTMTVILDFSNSPTKLQSNKSIYHHEINLYQISGSTLSYSLNRLSKARSPNKLQLPLVLLTGFYIFPLGWYPPYFMRMCVRLNCQLCRPFFNSSQQFFYTLLGY